MADTKSSLNTSLGCAVSFQSVTEPLRKQCSRRGRRRNPDVLSWFVCTFPHTHRHVLHPETHSYMKHATHMYTLTNEKQNGQDPSALKGRKLTQPRGSSRLKNMYFNTLVDPIIITRKLHPARPWPCKCFGAAIPIQDIVVRRHTKYTVLC